MNTSGNRTNVARAVRGGPQSAATADDYLPSQLPPASGEPKNEARQVVTSLDRARPGFTSDGNLIINPDFALVRNDYHVRLANDASHLQTKVSKLINNMYGARGLLATDSPAEVSTLPGLPDQVTLAACSGDRVFGTLTLGVDSGTGLLADTLYGEQIDEMRAQGRRVCEVTRLALDPELSTPEVMATIFNVAFVLAREVHARTDLFAEVHPRHAGFYRRTMGYQVAGPVRICPRVNAPAVLMHLCLDFAEAQIRRLAGKSILAERSLYSLFLPHSQQEVLLEQLTAPVSAAAA